MSFTLSFDRMISTLSIRDFSCRISARSEVRSQIFVLSSWFLKIWVMVMYL